MNKLWEALFPTRCGICGLLGDHAICEECLDAMEPLNMDSALFHYRKEAGEAVRRLKYFRATPLAGPMSALLVERYRERLEGLYDAVIPVPIHWSRRFYRGFNQAELLCEAFPSGLVQGQWLRRVKATRRQVGLDKEGRFRNLSGAFSASSVVKGKRLLLVDDVVTSGATYQCCREALMAAGAADVDLLAFAGTDSTSY